MPEEQTEKTDVVKADDYNKVVEQHNTVKTENEKLSKELEEIKKEKEESAQKAEENKVEEQKQSWEKEKEEMQKQNEELQKKLEEKQPEEVVRKGVVPQEIPPAEASKETDTEVKTYLEEHYPSPKLDPTKIASPIAKLVHFKNPMTKQYTNQQFGEVLEMAREFEDRRGIPPEARETKSDIVVGKKLF